MTDKDIKDSYTTICNLLADRQLKPAFDLFEKLISTAGLGEYRDVYNNLEQNYRFMLKYTVEGIKDPERQKIYQHLLISSFELADTANDNLKLKFSQTVEYQKKRGFAKLFIPDLKEFLAQLDEYSVQKELHSMFSETTISNGTFLKTDAHFQKIYTLFYHYWFTNKLSEEEVQFFRSFIQHGSFPYYEKALLVTSLILSLLRFFDENKITLLFESYESNDIETSQRALIGLLIGLYYYNQRMPFFHGITGRLQILIEDPRFKVNLENVILQFIRSKETEKIQRILQDEIIPEMMKISPNLRNKFNIEGLLTEGLAEDKNPGWQEIFKDSPGLMDKMEELTEMQMEGADVFMSSFSMLKNFPFFSEIANWFIPFTPEHPELLKTSINSEFEEFNNFLGMIMKSPMLCNSDKYSFCFSMQNITSDFKKMMSEGLKAEFDQAEELEKDQSFLDQSKKAETVSGQYIRDLYRFFKLYPQREGFEDIFTWRFDFHTKYAFAGLLSEDFKIQRNIAEFYFAKNYFTEAADIYEILLAENDDAEMLQKLAFCYQKQGNYKKALSYYLRADLYDQNKIWNLKKIALCYRNLKKPAKALEYYQQAVILEPDNLSLHISIGQCHMELQQYEEALKSYYKVEYLAPGNNKTWRPLGWCCLLAGKLDQAEKYYNQLISETPDKYDLMNMGHVQWCLGNRKAALDYYTESINSPDNSEKDFMDAFNEDLPHLLNQGVDPDDVPIMLDQLRYFLQE
jgi:tetratricopeptide (TPR) repeat protein